MEGKAEFLKRSKRHRRFLDSGSLLPLGIEKDKVSLGKGEKLRALTRLNELSKNEEPQLQHINQRIMKGRRADPWRGGFAGKTANKLLKGAH